MHKVSHWTAAGRVPSVMPLRNRQTHSWAVSQDTGAVEAEGRHWHKDEWVESSHELMPAGKGKTEVSC